MEFIFLGVKHVTWVHKRSSFDFQCGYSIKFSTTHSAITYGELELSLSYLSAVRYIFVDCAINLMGGPF